MSNPFEAPLRILRGWIHLPEPDQSQIEAAIRVLEAAGGIDKHEVQRFFHVLLSGMTSDNPTKNWEQVASIRALLSALPDEVKK